MARGPRLRKWRGPRSMAWLVARRELPPSLFSFLHGRTWSAPCFITFLTLLVSSPPRSSIPSLLIQTSAQQLGDTLSYFSSGFERSWLREVLVSRGGTLARHSSSRSVKSSRSKTLARPSSSRRKTLTRPFSSRSIKPSRNTSREASIIFWHEVSALLK